MFRNAHCISKCICVMIILFLNVFIRLLIIIGVYKVIMWRVKQIIFMNMNSWSCRSFVLWHFCSISFVYACLFPLKYMYIIFWDSALFIHIYNWHVINLTTYIVILIQWIPNPYTIKEHHRSFTQCPTYIYATIHSLNKFHKSWKNSLF